MKKIFPKLSALALCLGLFINTAYTQVNTTIYETSFEELNMPGWDSFDFDGDGKTWTQYLDPANAWMGSRVVAVEYNPLGNDDVLWSPTFYIPDNAISASVNFFAKAADPAYPESFQVRFTNGSGSTLVGYNTNVGGSYQSFAYSLNQFIGQSGWIEIRCNSVDKYFLILDDFSIKAVINNASVEEPAPVSISVFPNPATDVVNVGFHSMDKYGLRISDIYGKTLLVKDGIQSEIYQTDISSLPTGVYLLTVTTKNNTYVKRIVKQ